MSSTAVATAPNGDSGNPHGYCSQCRKVWILKERQGVCPWCHKPASCITATSKPRQFKSRSRRRKRQASVHSNGYDHLEGQWLLYYKVAVRFTGRVKAQDKEDILHTIIVTLADVERNNGHKPFTEAVMYRIASLTVANYWRAYYKANNGLDCGSCSRKQRRRCREYDLFTECPRAVKLESLNQPITDSEGRTTELGELIADDKALDLDAWMDYKTFLLTSPERLILIGKKIRDGIALSHAERNCLYKYRKREQNSLFQG
jgi:hypothetical protein